MVLTTTDNIENFKIVDYLGIVTGIFSGSGYSHKDVKLSFKDMFNTSKYTEAYLSGIENVKEKAFQNLKDNAKKLGANAVVGVNVDIEYVTNSSSILVSITGTAVKVQ